jgi:hypothetical protein
MPLRNLQSVRNEFDYDELGNRDSVPRPSKEAAAGKESYGFL